MSARGVSASSQLDVGQLVGVTARCGSASRSDS